MGKIRRAGFLFLFWKGDHLPRHVHVYQDGELVVKWDLDRDRPIYGTASRKVKETIRALRAEGQL